MLCSLRCLVVYYAIYLAHLHSASFASKKVMVDDLLIRISYVDAPGTERYMQVLDTFYKDMHAAIVVYSVTSRDSVPRMKTWAKTIREHPSTPKDLVLVVVGACFASISVVCCVKCCEGLICL